MDASDKYTGRVFDKRYKIEKMCGIGGMAMVFRAEDLLMNRTVAIKMLKDDISNDAENVQRFINESKAVAMLSHENIVNIYDVSVKENLKYIVMEYIEGINLKAYVKRKGGKLSWLETLNITEQILRALAHAHSKGVVHRDIKPQNIMLLKSGIIKVADFGIAKIPDSDTLTKADKAIGTVHYISPEQARGKDIDSKSDLYSVGVLMYELSCGRLPFTADTPVQVALKQLNEQPDSPCAVNPELPVGMEQIIMRAMEKDPALRYRTAGQMLKHISALKENPNIRFRPPAVPKGDGAEGEAAESSAGAKNKKGKRGAGKGDNKNKVVRTRGGMLMPMILGVVSAFLIVTAVIAIIMFNRLTESMSSTTTRDIKVDSYVGMMYSDALVAELEFKGLVVEKRAGFGDDEVAINTIVRQYPEAEQTVKENSTITLFVYEGEKKISLPNFYSQKYNDVVAINSSQYSFTLTRINVSSDTVSDGCVIRTEPEPGSMISAGDEVKLYVSTGASIDNTTVPTLFGMNANAAIRALIDRGLTVGNITYADSETAKDCVIEQSVFPNTEVPLKTTVDLVLSYGPVETEPPETEPETEEEETEEPGWHWPWLN